MRIKDLKIELDKLQDEWDMCLKANKQDEVSYKKRTILWNKISELVFDCYGGKTDYDDALSGFLVGELLEFDKDKSSLSSFVTIRIPKRKMDVDRSEKRHTDKIGLYLDDNTNDKVNNFHEIYGDLDKDIEQAGSLDNSTEIMIKIIPMIYNMKKNISGRANNERRIMHFRNFYTDDISYLVVSTSHISIYLDKENEIMEAINTDFLDFFTVDECRTINDIRNSKVKEYSLMVPGKNKILTEDKRPFPADVYKRYYKDIEKMDVTDSALTQQRKFYYEFIRTNLEE